MIEKKIAQQLRCLVIWLIDIKLLERLGTCRTDERDKDDEKGIEPAPRTRVERPLATLTVFLGVVV
jgi:hypothetical protein